MEHPPGLVPFCRENNLSGCYWCDNCYIFKEHGNTKTRCLPCNKRLLWICVACNPPKSFTGTFRNRHNKLEHKELSVKLPRRERDNRLQQEITFDDKVIPELPVSQNEVYLKSQKCEINDENALYHELFESPNEYYNPFGIFAGGEPFIDLYSAIKKGDVYALEVMHTIGTISLYLIDSSGFTALHYASLFGHINVVHFLISQGVYTNPYTPLQITPLHIAARAGHKEVVNYLINSGASLDSRAPVSDYPLITPLGMALLSDYYETALEILGHLERRNITNYSDNPSFTMAYTRGAVSLFQRISMISLNSEFIMGSIIYIFKSKASISHWNQLVDMLHCVRSLKDKDGNSLLHCATANNCNLWVIDLLLHLGTEINLTNNSGDTVLHLAAVSGSYELIVHLLQCGANAEIMNIIGQTALHVLVSTSSNIQLIWHMRAAINVVPRDGITVLHSAVSFATRKVVAELLRVGADPYVQEPQKKLTPLHIAAFLGREDIVQLFLLYSINPNMSCYDGRTPLHMAVEKRFESVAYQLIENGASLKVKGRRGWTPLHQAAHNGMGKLAVEMVNNGAEVNAVDDEGNTPLDCALQAEENYEVVGLLMSLGAVMGVVIV